MEPLPFIRGRPEDVPYDCRLIESVTHVFEDKMAGRVLNRIASLGLGVAVVGGVVNTALYNGKAVVGSQFCRCCAGKIKGRRCLNKDV